MPREYRQYLEAPLSYWDAPDNVRTLLCNGAGPEGLPSWVVPDTMYGLRITEAANIHDWMYVWGETPADKQQADETFLINLMRIINERTTRWPVVGHILRALRHRRALKYYEAVCVLGDKAFESAHGVRPEGYLAALKQCDRPPVGWFCTRPYGHPGPCAAAPLAHRGMTEEETNPASPDA